MSDADCTPGREPRSVAASCFLVLFSTSSAFLVPCGKLSRLAVSFWNQQMYRIVLHGIVKANHCCASSVVFPPNSACWDPVPREILACRLLPVLGLVWQSPLLGYFLSDCKDFQSSSNTLSRFTSEIYNNAVVDAMCSCTYCEWISIESVAAGCLGLMT